MHNSHLLGFFSTRHQLPYHTSGSQRMLVSLCYFENFNKFLLQSAQMSSSPTVQQMSSPTASGTNQ